MLRALRVELPHPEGMRWHRPTGVRPTHPAYQTNKLVAGGALWGGLIGLIFFVPLLGMAIGAASGAAGGAMSDAGVDDQFMKELGQELAPGNAAVIALVRNITLDKVLEDIRIPGRIIRSSLDNETEAQLQEALTAAGRA